MKVHEIMTPHPSYVTLDDSIARAAVIMRELDVGLVPVVADSASMTLEGVLTDRDIAIRCVSEQHGSACRVRDHMTSGDLDTVTADSDVTELIAKMKRDRVRRIPVVGENDRLAGIVAQADLAVKVGPVLPLEVERVLERVSEPGHDVAAGSARV